MTSTRHSSTLPRGRRRTIALAAWMIAGCGDSTAQTEGSGSSGSTGGSDSAGTTSGGLPTGETGEEATTSASETTDTTAPTGGPTTAATGEGASETGEPMRCFEGNVFAEDAELTAKSLAGFDCVTGDVQITGGTGPDLWFLGEIRAIGGSLEIVGPHPLVSLHGLEQLETIGGVLDVGQAPALTDASALAGLVAIGAVRFRDAPKLAALDLGELTALGGDFEFTGAALTSLDVTALTGTANAVALTDTKLPDLTGLASLTSLHGLTLTGNSELVDLSGLTSLGQLEAHLRIEDSPALVSLAGLAVAPELDEVALRSNKLLTDLGALQEVQTLGRLDLGFNASLTSLAPLAGVTVLQTVTIEGNPALESLTQLEGSIIRLEVIGNLALASLTGLEGLTVTDDVMIADNNALTGLQGLGPLAPEMWTIRIIGNGALQSLAGPKGPVFVHVLEIVDNPQLTSMALLADMSSADQLRIRGNQIPSLIDLSALTSVTEFVLLDDNPALASLTGLEQLVATERLYVRQNPKLTGLAALQDGALTDVTFEYDVFGNTQLPSCAVKALHDKLVAPPQDFCFDNKPDACTGLGGCVDHPVP